MNKKYAVLLNVLFILFGCGGSDDLPTIPADAGSISGSGSIQSAFNGYILKSSSIDNFEPTESSFVSFYNYDSDNRTITRSNAPDVSDKEFLPE